MITIPFAWLTTQEAGSKEFRRSKKKKKNVRDADLPTQLFRVGGSFPEPDLPSEVGTCFWHLDSISPQCTHFYSLVSEYSIDCCADDCFLRKTAKSWNGWISRPSFLLLVREVLICKSRLREGSRFV
jgi:hypothetical protein